MSRGKSKTILLTMLLLIVSFFAFGCKSNKAPVEDIYFKVEGNEEQIVLLIGETLELEDYVYIKPNYASNKQFYLESYDSSVVAVSNRSIKALKEGSTYVKVVSEDNSNRHDVINVLVKSSQVVLDTPSNLNYNEQTQAFTFNPVLNAAGYVISIRDVKANKTEEYNLGSLTTFSLENYEGTKYNTVLAASVKAYAPSYTYVFKDSVMSNNYSIYQCGSVTNAKVENGLLSFSQNSSTNAIIHYNNELIGTYSSISVTHKLTELDKKYSGSTIKIKVTTSAKDQSDESINYFNGKAAEINVSVLEQLNVVMNDSVLSWNNVANVDKYEIYINNAANAAATTSNNYFDLKDLFNFNNFKNETDDYIINVVPVLNANSVNIAKTKEEESIKFNRLKSVAVRLTEDGIEWDAVEKANVYSININYLRDNKVVSTTTTSTTATSLSFKNYVAGDYDVSVQAVSITEGDVNYLSSLVESSSSKKFSKLAQTSVSISDYELKISTPNSIGDYRIDYVLNKNIYKTNTFTAFGLTYNESLKNNDLTPGLHTINVVRKGNGIDTINSSAFSYSFYQLAPIDVIDISNNKISVEKGEINIEADNPDVVDDVVITLETPTDGKTLTTTELEMEFNTLDESSEYFLKAGTHTASVYIEGNGSTTFSYMRGGNLVPSATCEIIVLEAPVISFTDSSKTEISYTNTTEGSYTIYENAVALIDEYEGTIYEFELEEGSKTFIVQANGNGSNVLSSKLSDSITVTRLADPELFFSNISNKISISYNNSTNYLNSAKMYNIQLKNANYTNYTEIEYSFGTEFTQFEIGLNEIVVNLNSVLYDDFKQSYYLNSKDVKISLTKLNNETTFEINEDNQLIVKSKNKLQTNLELTFHLDSGNKTFKTEDSNLVQGSTCLPFEYVEDSDGFGIYVVDLVEDYEVILEDFMKPFKVEVKYLMSSDDYVNSDLSNVSEDLTLNRISVENTSININNNNELIIKGYNHSKEYYLEVVFIIDSDTYYFNSNEDKNSLDYSTFSLLYSFDDASKSYHITLLNDDYTPIWDDLNKDFSVKVKYLHKLGGSDLDSEYSEQVDFIKLSTATLTRSEQNIILTSPYLSYTYENFAILVNNDQLIDLDSSCIVDSGKITIEFDYIYNKITGVQADVVYSIAVVTKNNAVNLALSSVGEAVKVKRYATPEITSTKDNNSANNSVVIHFISELETYAKKVKLNIANDEDNIVKLYEFKANAAETEILFNLDTVELLGNLTVDLNVETIGSDADGVFVFNSELSNKLTFEKISAPNIISVDNDVITFEEIENAVYYEIYEVVGGSEYRKIEGSATTTSCKLSGLEATTKKLVFKAISKVGDYTNSAYGEEFELTKLEAPTVKIVDGSMVVENLLRIEDVDICIIVYNKIFGIVKTINYSEEPNDEFIVKSNAILKYGTTNIIEEEIEFYYFVNGSDAGYYLNSDKTKIKAKGLFAPINLRKITDAGNTNVQQIYWENDSRNGSYSVNYEFELEYKGLIYYSSDEKLKYYDEGELKTYGNITSTVVNFPLGYDFDNNGSLDDSDDVKFDEGEIKIKIRTFPAMDGTDNLCSSDYSEEYSFEFLNKPSIFTSNGYITWDKVSKANNYDVLIYKFNGTNYDYVKTENVTGTTYELTGFSSNVYKVTVKARSNRNDILDSAVSNEVVVYKLNTVIKVYVEDGYLILETNKYFHTAKLTFEIGGETLEISYLNGVKEVEVKPANDVSRYIIDKEANITSQRNYNVYVKLFGDNSDIKYSEEISVPIINSDDKKFDIQAHRFNPIVKEIESGKFKFLPDSAYCEIDEIEETFTISGATNLQYKFRTSDSTYTDEINNTIAYKINLKVGDGDTITLLALDYFSLKYNNIDYNSNYKEIDGLKFNVFENNIIDLNDNLSVYTVNIDQDAFPYIYTNPEDIYEINVIDGGKFEFEITMLGGDAESDVGYLNSVVSKAIFIRYTDLEMNSLGGLAFFEDARMEEDKTDKPVYVVDSGDEKRLFLYYDGLSETEAKSIAGRIDNTGFECLYIKIVENGNAYVQGANIMFDLGQYIDAGYSTTKIRILAGIDNTNNDIYYLNSKVTNDEYAYYKLSDVIFTYGNGMLKIDPLSNIPLDNDKYIYSYSYQITLSDGQNDNVYYIHGGTEGVEVVENKYLTYVIPGLQAGKTYKIKVRALENVISNVDSFNGMILNGSYKKDESGNDIFVDFTKAAAVYANNVKVENGVLTWNANGYDEINVKVYNETTDETFIFNAVGDEISVGTYAYQFADGAYQYINGNIYVKENCFYEISVQLVGNKDWEINSDYSTVISDVVRLNTIKSSTILANDGVLTWNEIEDAVGYNVEIITDSLTYIYSTTSNSLDLTTIDNNGNVLNVGENFKVVIRALGDEKLHSVASKAVNFKKINKIDNSKIAIVEDYIAWESDNNALCYNVVFSYDGKDVNYMVEETKCVAPDDIDGAFTVLIQSFIGGENKIIASDYAVREYEIDKPEAVSSVNYIKNSFKFEVCVNMDDSLIGDRLKVTFELAKRTDKENVFENLLEEIVMEIPANGIFEYYLEDIGIYKNFTAKILRDDTFGSIKTTHNKDEDFNIYAYGNGKEFPYAVKTAEQLTNIYYFAPKAKNFKVVNDIELKESDYVGKSFIISENFNGTIDGYVEQLNANSTISFEDNKINIKNKENFAMFNNLQGATIKNLQIGGSNGTTLSNSFDSAPENMVNLSVIAIGVTNSTIENVYLSKFGIQLNSNGVVTIAQPLKISGLVCNATNSTLKNNKAELEVEISNSLKIKSNTNKFYVSSLISELDGGEVGNNESVLNFEHNNTGSVIDYVGAIAFAEDTNIKNLKSELTINNTIISYIGGTVGYAKNTEISECESGLNVTINHEEDIYIGGIVGGGIGLYIENTNVAFSDDMFYLNFGSNQYIGGVVGYLEGNAEQTSSIDECLYKGVQLIEIKITKTDQFELGLCGFAYSGF